MSGNKVIEYIIAAKDATGAGIKSALSRIGSFASAVGRNLMNVKAGFDMLGGLVASFKEKLALSLTFERETQQFKTLIGSIDEAKAHMADLKDLGDTPPFSLDAFAAASKEMMVMTQGVLGYKESLKMVGDVASATGKPLESVAHSVGLLYQSLADGAPIDRAAMSLVQMGVITPGVRDELKEMQESGADLADVWSLVTDEMKKHEGAMEDTEKTGEGLMGAVSSRWDNIVRAFGDTVLDASKGPLQNLLERMKTLEEDGTIEVWAQNASRWIKRVADWFKELIGWVGKVMGYMKTAWNWIEGGAAAVGAFAGSLAGGASLSDAWSNAGEAAANHIMEKERQAREEAEVEVRVKAAAAKRVADRKVAEEKRAAAEQARIAENLAAKQEELAQKAAQKAAAKAEREKAAAAEKARVAGLRDGIKANNERLAAEREKVDGRVRALEEAKRAQGDAAEKARQAWGFFLDPNAMQDQMDEERRQAKAEKSFGRKFDSLRKMRPDWRTARNLSARQEAVRRVALAREEEEKRKAAVKDMADDVAASKNLLSAIEAAVKEENDNLQSLITMK